MTSTIEHAAPDAHVVTGGQIAVEDPATGAVVDRVSDMSASDVHALAEAARAVQPRWAALGFGRRANVLKRMSGWLSTNAEEVIEVICRETGKTYDDAQITDWSYGLMAFDFWAKHAEGYLADERIKPASWLNRSKRLTVRYEPLGLVGVIGPWNYPLALSVGDAIPALAAGNAVLLKPSELTPLTSLLLQRGLRECGLPDGVLQVATGGGRTGAAVVDEVDMVMFTGSTATGQAVMERAARTLTPVSLELGGKDPMIVLADADVERAANCATYYSMFNSGQTCISVERVYVEDPVYDEFVARVTAKLRALRHAPSTGPGSSDVGAMTAPAQLEVVTRHVEDALARGARAVVGGTTGAGGRPGYWFAPTLLLDVDHSMACMREETFGPTLPIMRVRDAEEAIRLANDSPYGLAASVFGRDAKRAEAIARRLEAGAVCVNDAVVNYSMLELPMGGWKASGIGARHGPGGIRKYCRQQSVMVSRLHGRKEPFMYPYRPRTTRALQRVLRLAFGRGG